ncbi:hypothetical protein AM593_08634, partial [Mytilus galloprovincialis]
MPGTGRRYGFFRCTNCRAQWESAYVFCVSQWSDGEYYEQDCKKCNTACSPYKVEKLKCSKCGQSNIENRDMIGVMVYYMHPANKQT